ncbi:MAG: LLM class flavin-dependent oxidoreductase [Rhodospirillaceae bacterium]|nr:LLM class flavin-dependent oxidoreductase [Rhodospirillaceae bacterium]
MKVWHFSEMAYPDAWDTGYKMDTFRVTVPNSHYDPKIGSKIYHRHYDEFQLCDELGINIMLNEHHSTLTCTNAAITVSGSILARITQNVRILLLGTPIANRPDPIRVAEEMAMIDVISKGRLEMGLVKGAPYEIAPANTNPARLMERFWEAHDLILKAMSSRDGPFNWESENFHYRQVNIWPRPWQEPHPPVWITALSPNSGRAIAERGHVAAALLSGGIASGMFNAYRERAAELGWAAPNDRLAYCALVGVGHSEEEGRLRADKVAGYVRTSPIVAEPFKNPPGYNPVQANVMALKTGPDKSVARVKTFDGRTIDPTKANVQEFIDSRTVFAGTPDQVFEQIKTFNQEVGGFGHLIIMGQGGTLSYEETCANLRLFSKEVVPRLSEIEMPENPYGELAQRNASAAQ